VREYWERRAILSKKVFRGLSSSVWGSTDEQTTVRLLLENFYKSARLSAEKKETHEDRYHSSSLFLFSWLWQVESLDVRWNTSSFTTDSKT
jgi:hypothetical protein